MELDQKAKGLKLEEEKEDVNGSLQTRLFPQLSSFFLLGEHFASNRFHAMRITRPQRPNIPRQRKNPIHPKVAARANHAIPHSFIFLELSLA
jgi:hypothetical protein